MKHYVVGIALNHFGTKVVVVKKNKPESQAGLFNGPGGKIEDGETELQTMVREWREETGMDTHPGVWLPFGRLIEYGVFQVHLFATRSIDISQARTMEDEEISVIPVLHVGVDNSVENLPWIIPAAFDCLCDGRPKFIQAQY